MANSQRLDDPLEEAERLVALADERGLAVRLVGGLAIQAKAPGWRNPTARDGRDIDLATRSADRKALTSLMVDEGYEPDRQYNALYGHKQLYFVDPARGRPVDVLVDRLEMCHRFEFAERLALDHPTLPIADLLLSKLQIVRINEKDVLDALVLLAEHPLADDPGSGIDVPRVVALLSTDWGWWRTVTMNLAKLRDFAPQRDQLIRTAPDRPRPFDPVTQIRALEQAIEAAPKSTRWKLRARVGDRVPWYEEPEEVGHGRD